MKKIVLMISLLFICGCNPYKDYSYIAEIDLNDDPQKVCGEKVYFSDDIWDNEITISSIIDRIYEACDIDNKNKTVDNYNQVKEEIDYLISNSDDYTKEEFIDELENIYDNLLDK